MDIQLLTHTSMSNTTIMNSFGLKLVASAAIAGTITIAMGSSAEAAGLTGRFDFGWKADANAANIDFKPASPTVSALLTGIGVTPTNDAGGGDFFTNILEGSFLALPNIDQITLGQIQDLPTFSGPVADFISFDKVLTAAAGLGITGLPNAADYRFTLTNFMQSAAKTYTFTGVFGDGTLGEGEITTQILGTGVKAYSGTLVAKSTPVPTPVLLPGLIGLGMAAMRKRQAKAALA
jgi:hypothetical protein